MADELLLIKAPVSPEQQMVAWEGRERFLLQAGSPDTGPSFLSYPSPGTGKNHAIRRTQTKPRYSSAVVEARPSSPGLGLFSNLAILELSLGAAVELVLVPLAPGVHISVAGQ